MSIAPSDDQKPLGNLTWNPAARLPRRTPNGHNHAEAFCLMWYQCKDCGAKERIWNSRDGVTPFGMRCPSCGRADYYHTYFGSDLYAPNWPMIDIHLGE